MGSLYIKHVRYTYIARLFANYIIEKQNVFVQSYVIRLQSKWSQRARGGRRVRSHTQLGIFLVLTYKKILIQLQLDLITVPRRPLSRRLDCSTGVEVALLR